jgi:hypothetical protein
MNISTPVWCVAALLTARAHPAVSCVMPTMERLVLPRSVP